MPTPSLRRELGKRRAFERPEEEAYLNVLRTAAVLSAPVEALFRRHGLSAASYNVLRILRGHRLGGRDGVPSQSIGPQMVALVPDVTRLVDRLVRAGLARRARTPDDRRVVLVRITPRGLDLLARLDGPTSSLVRSRLSHLSRSELAALSRLLVKARRPHAPTPVPAPPRRRPGEGKGGGGIAAAVR